MRATDVKLNGTGSESVIDGVRIELGLAGEGDVQNVLGAWSVCESLGVTIEEFAADVRGLSAVDMRMEILKYGDLMVINDCYNANPASMKNALEILANLSSDKKRRAVFIRGDMAELGRQAEFFHAELGGSIAQAKVQLLLAVGKYAKTVAEAAKAAADYDLQIKCFEDTVSACNNLEEFIKYSDIVLVKGSRTAKLETAIEKLKGLFG